MKRTIKKLSQRKLDKIINESIKAVLENEDEFTPHGYKTTSNLGGHEVQISRSGDAARFRFYGGKPTDWLEIEFDEDGVAYVNTERGKELICDYMRY